MRVGFVTVLVVFSKPPVVVGVAVVLAGEALALIPEVIPAVGPGVGVMAPVVVVDALLGVPVGEGVAALAACTMHDNSLLKLTNIIKIICHSNNLLLAIISPLLVFTSAIIISL